MRILDLSLNSLQECDPHIIVMINERMKKVLIIVPFFPGLGGDRIVKFVKYLGQFGYYPIVLTTRGIMSVLKIGQNDSEKAVAAELQTICTIHRTICFAKSPFRVFSKLTRTSSMAEYLDKLFFIPDLLITWIPIAILKIVPVIYKNRIEAIITSSPPESTHVLGLIIKKITGLTWIADFRDLWTSKKINHRPATPMHHVLVSRIERTIYKEASRIIANTYGNRKLYIRKFKIPPKKISVITNGFDPEERRCTNQELNEKKVFRIGYMGRFDKPGFPWKEFLFALNGLLNNESISCGIVLNIYGSVSKETKIFINNNGLDKYILCHGVLTHSNAFSEVAKSDMLLVLMYETEYSTNIVPHKVYHYLGMGKPIFAVAEEDGELAAIIKSTNTGYVVSTKRQNGIRDTLKELINKWSSGNDIPYVPDENVIRNYNIVNLTEKLAMAIDTEIQ